MKRMQLSLVYVNIDMKINILNDIWFFEIYA